MVRQSRLVLGSVAARVCLTLGREMRVILAAGPEFKLLATNELDGSYTLASPAVSGSQLFLRTGTTLYCIGKSAPA